jgi:glycosyltransferase involved in cell wall biosynthesis
MPKVSICVPNLNTRPFLRQRFETIFSQTLQDWDLFVYDGYSDDGSWEYIQELASSQPRMRIAQGPREGPISSWNPCIRQARGDYVYIATSDDTMMPECLEKMVAALESNPDCGICQCELVIIDENGAPFPEARQWPHYTLGTYDRNLVLNRNKRLAPHDGIVHPALFTIYTSITQLLIRRSVFDRVGSFDGRWGSISDFEWGMRAGLLENCIYIPEKLATWRRHPNQATKDVHTPGVRLQMIEMARSALSRAQACGGAGLGDIDIEDLTYCLQRDFVELSCKTSKGRREKAQFLLEQLFRRPRPVIDHLLSHFQDEKWGPWKSTARYDCLRRLLKKYRVSAPVFDGAP